MSLHIGEIAPNFQADTTAGHVDFHNWIGDSWAFFFSHPADWKPGGKVIIPPSISNEEAKKLFPQGWDEVRSYLRYTKVA